jgi:hypothetical protein
LWAPIALGLVITAVTWQRFSNGLAWDDPLILDALRRLVHEHRLERVFGYSTVSIVLERDADGATVDLYRPLALLSFVAIDRVFGTGPGWQHGFNLLLHLGSVVLVYILAQRRPFELSWPYALFASAWFGLMPALGEAHLWISGRFDLLSTLFALAAVYLQKLALLSESAARRRGLALSAGLFFLASLLSKEASALVAVALVFLPDGSPLRHRLRSILPFAVALLGYTAIRIAALGVHLAGRGPDVATMSLNAGTFVLDALRTALWPGAQYVRAPIEDYEALGSAVRIGLAVACGALCLLAWAARRRQPALAWSFLWFVLCLAPAISVTTLYWTGFGRYLHLPASLFLPGVVVALRGALQAHPRFTARMQRTAAAIYLGTSALWLHAFAATFVDSEAVYSAITRAAPERSHGWGFLGIDAMERGQYPRAVTLLSRAHTMAPGDPRYVPPLVRALLLSGDTEQARAVADRAIERWPAEAKYRLLAAHTRVRTEPERAIDFIIECLRLDQHHEECRDALAFLGHRDPRRAQLKPGLIARIEREPDLGLRAELSRLVQR